MIIIGEKFKTETEAEDFCIKCLLHTEELKDNKIEFFHKNNIVYFKSIDGVSVSREELESFIKKGLELHNKFLLIHKDFKSDEEAEHFAKINVMRVCLLSNFKVAIYQIDSRIYLEGTAPKDISNVIKNLDYDL